MVAADAEDIAEEKSLPILSLFTFVRLLDEPTQRLTWRIALRDGAES